MRKIKIKGVIIPNDYKWFYDMFDVDATCPADVEKALNEANGESIEVEINSPGGEVYSGSEIYTVLKAYKGKVTVNIVGVAASAASVIAMAGDVVRISPTAQIMIHNVSSTVHGDYRVLGHEAEVIKNYNVSIANAYRLKTGMSEDELLKLMGKGGSANLGTWLNAQQAKELGFVDEIMFDEQGLLVASVADSPFFPPSMVSKLRNLLQDHEALKRQNAELKARLDLLKLKEAKN